MSNGNYDTSTWFSPMKISVPFDTSTVFGWYMRFLISMWISICQNMYVSSSIPFFANCCSYIHACYEQFKLDYLNFNNNFSKYLKKRFKLKRNYVPPSIETFESQLIDLVRFHIKIKEYANFYKSVGLELFNEIVKRKLHFRVFDDVAESNSGTLFFQLYGNVIYF